MQTRRSSATAALAALACACSGTPSPSAPSKWLSRIRTPSTAAVADGQTPLPVSVTLLDPESRPLAGRVVVFQVNAEGVEVAQPPPTAADGTTQGTVSATTSGIKTVVVSAGDGSGGTISLGQATLRFIGDAGHLSADRSTAVANRSGGVVADGVASADITVSVVDVNGNAVAGVAVALECPGAIIAQPGGTTDASGAATGHVASREPGLRRITATANGLALTQAAQVSFIFDPGQISDELSTVVASPQSLVADGSAAATVTVTVLDRGGNPVPAERVILSSEDGQLLQPAAPTGVDGVASGTLATTHAGLHIVKASIDDGAGTIPLVQSARVDFTADAAHLSAALSTLAADSGGPVIADGAASATVTVTVRDVNGNPVSGVPVALSAPGAQVSSPIAPTDDSGATTARVTATTAGVKSVSATLGTARLALAQPVTIAFVADASHLSASLSSVVASPVSGLVADGVAAAHIAVTVRDRNGNLVPGVPVSVAAPGAAVAGPAGATDASGVATAQVTATLAGSKTLSVTAGSGAAAVHLAAQPQLGFIGDAAHVSANLSTFGASPAAGIVADGTASAALSVQVRDVNGNAVSAVSVVFSAADAIVTNPGAPTDASGAAAGSIASIHAGSKAVTATAAGVQLAQRAQVAFIGDSGHLSASGSSVAAQPASGVVADGSATAVITVAVRDVNGNPVPGVPVSLAAPGAQAASPAQPTGADGLATGAVASLHAGAIAVSARAGGVALTQTAQVGFIGDATHLSATLSSATASPAAGVVADGRATSAIAVTVRDVNGNPVPGVAVALTAADALVTGAVSGSDGVAACTVASPHAGTKVVTVSAGSGGAAVQVGAPLGVTFVGDPGNLSAALSGVVATPGSGVVADGTASAAVQVTVRDANGNPVAGQTVKLAAPGGIVLDPAGPTGSDGVATGAVTSTHSGTLSVSATAGGTLSLTQIAQVTFVGDASHLSAALSTLSGPTGALPADGATPAALSVVVRDINGNPVQGVTVVLAAADAQVTGPAQPTAADGSASGSITATHATTKTVTATAGGVTLTQTASVVFIGDAAHLSLGGSSVSASPTSVVADGSAAATVAVIVRDVHGNAVPGVSVALSALDASVISPAAATDANGTAAGSIRAVHAGVKAITASVGAQSLTQQAQVTFVGDASNVSAALSSATSAAATLVADGVAFARITVTVRDGNGNAVQGQTVTLAAPGASVVNPASPTDASGVASGTVTATAAGLKTVTATVGSGGSAVAVAQQPQVTFIGDAAHLSAALSGVSASPAGGVPANGTSAATVTVVVRDLNGNAVQGQAVSVAAGGATVTGPAAGTDALGVVTASVTSLTSGARTVVATVGGALVLAQKPQITFVGDAGNLSASLSTATASPTGGVLANGSASAAIKVTVRDVNGNPVPGVAVALSAPGATALNPPGATDANGVASGGLQSDTPGKKTVTVTAGAVVLAQAPQVTFIADTNNIDLNRSKVAASVAQVVADGVSSAVITVTVLDINGDPVPGQTVALAADDALVTSPAAVTDASGAALGAVAAVHAGAKTVFATVAGEAIVQTVTVTFIGDAAHLSAPLSSIVATPASGLVADGLAAASIAVTARDVNGNAVPGVPVALSAANATVTNPAAVTDANGLATGAVRATRAGTKSVGALLGSGGSAVQVAQAAQVGFIGDAAHVSASLSTLSAAGGSFVADGSASAALTVTVRDVNGNVVPGVMVALAALDATVTSPAAATDASGVASGSIRATHATPKTVTATAAGVTLTQTATVTFIGDATHLSAGLSTFTATPSSGLAADGTTTSALAVTVRDVNNNPVPGVAVSLAASDGIVANPAAATDASGLASGAIAAIHAGTKSLTATAGSGAFSIQLGATVAFVADAAHLSASLSTVASSVSNLVADGLASAAITVTVRDVNGNVVAGQAVVLAAAGATLAQGAATDASGVSTGSVSATAAGTRTVTARVGAGALLLAQQPQLVFIGDASHLSASLSSISATPSSSVVADGSSSAAIAVTVRDVNGNVVPGVTVALSALDATVLSPGAASDTGGVATGSVRAIHAGSKVVSAALGAGALAITQTASVGFIGDAAHVSADNSSVVATPASNVPANGTTAAAIAVTVRDVNGNAVPGVTVALSAPGAAATNPAASSDASGLATGSVKASVAGTKTISATAGGVALTQQATVAFIGDAAHVSASLSTLSAAGGSFVADGVASAALTVTVRDVNGNVVPGVAVALSALDATVTNPAAATDASGVASGSIKATHATTKTVTATAGGVTLAQTASATFIGDAAHLSAALSTFTATPAAGVVADGVRTSALAVALRDVNNNPVSGVAVTLLASDGTVTQPAAATDASGLASGTIAAIHAGTKSLTATAGNGALSIQLGATVAFVADAAHLSASLSTVAASASNLVADGSASAAITVTVRDVNGNAVAGQAVVLAAAGATVAQGAATDLSGVSTGAVSATAAGTKTVAARVGAGALLLVQQPLLVFIGDAGHLSASLSSISATPSSNVVADGSSSAAIAVTVRDVNGNVVPGVSVALSALDATVLSPGAASDASGVATGSVRSIHAGSKVVSAALGAGALAITQTASVSFIGDAARVSAGNSSVVATPASNVPANGTATASIAVTVRDVNGNSVPGVSVTLSALDATVINPGASSDANGLATGSIAAIHAGTRTVSATAGAVAITQQAAVAFVGDAAHVSASLSTVTASPASGVVADGKTATVITVTVRDVNGNAVAGQAVTLAAPGTSVVNPAAATDATGTTSGSATATLAGLKTVTASAGAVTLAQQPTVAFIGDANHLSASLSTLAASPASGVVADGVATAALTVTVRDVNGNAVPSVQVALAALDATVASPAASSDASGLAAGTIAAIHAGAKVVTATIGTGAGALAVAQQASVGFIGDAAHVSASLSTATATPANNVVANGVAAAAIAVAVRDVNNNAVPGVTVTLATSDATATNPAAATDASGLASGALRSIHSGIKTVTVTAGSVQLSQQPAVAFIGDAAHLSASLSTAVASPATAVVANGSASSAIAVTVRDVNGNPVAGQAVKLTTTGATVTNPAAATDPNGLATGSIAATSAGTKTITVTAGAATTLSAQPTVGFIGDATRLSASLSTVAGVPASGTVADGVSAAGVVVTAIDVNGNPVPGVSVALATSEGAIVSPAAPTAADGTATGALSTLHAGSKSVTATLTAGALVVPVTQAAAVGFIGDVKNLSASLSTLAATPLAGVVANGSTAATVTVTVLDVNGNPVPNAAVVLTSALGLAMQPAPTNASGVATGGLASIVAGNVLVFATAGSGATAIALTQTATVGFIGDAAHIGAAASSLVASPVTNVAANGVAASTLTATVRDVNNNAVPGVVVTFAAPGATPVNPLLATDANGVATGSVKALSAGTKTITGTAGSGATAVAIAQQAQVTFIADATNLSGLFSMVGASPTSNIVANNVATSVFSVTVRDLNGNPVQGVPVALTVTPAAGATASTPALSDASGLTSGTVKATAAGTKTVKITLGSGANAVVVALQPTIVFIADAGNLSSTNSKTTAAPATGLVAGVSTATVTTIVQDVNKNPVPGLTVVLTGGDGTVAVTQPAAATDATGTATGSITTTKAGVHTVSAAVGAVATGSASTTWVAAPATKLSFLVQPPATAVRNATFTPSVQVAAQDANGNTDAAGFGAGSIGLALGNPQGATLTGGAAKAAVAGVATFALSVDTAGTGYALVASSTPALAAGGTSNTFSITTGPLRGPGPNPGVAPGPGLALEIVREVPGAAGARYAVPGSAGPLPLEASGITWRPPGARAPGGKSQITACVTCDFLAGDAPPALVEAIPEQEAGLPGPRARLSVSRMPDTYAGSAARLVPLFVDDRGTALEDDDLLYLSAPDAAGHSKLHRWDGEAFAQVADTNPFGDDDPAVLAIEGGRVLFRATDSVRRVRLFLFDGASVTLLSDDAPPAPRAASVEYASAIWLESTESAGPSSLLRREGARWSRLPELAPGAQPRSPVVFQGGLWFSLGDAGAAHLWRLCDASAGCEK